jgi:hypothetical protein
MLHDEVVTGEGWEDLVHLGFVVTVESEEKAVIEQPKAKPVVVKPVVPEPASKPIMDKAVEVAKPVEAGEVAHDANADVGVADSAVDTAASGLPDNEGSALRPTPRGRRSRG